MIELSQQSQERLEEETINIQLGPNPHQAYLEAIAEDYNEKDTKQYISNLPEGSGQARSSIRSSLVKQYEHAHEEFPVDQLQQQQEPSSITKFTNQASEQQDQAEEEQSEEFDEEASEESPNGYLQTLVASENHTGQHSREMDQDFQDCIEHHEAAAAHSARERNHVQSVASVEIPGNLVQQNGMLKQHAKELSMSSIKSP